MTVSTEVAKSGPYAGAGTTGPFTVGFRFLANTHLQVIKTVGGIETTLSYPADYSVTGAGASSGTVITTASVAVGETLTIIRDVPFTQEADYVQNDDFPAESHEQALDKLTMMAQQLKEGVDRALTLPASVPPGTSTQLPSPEADALIGWNSTADALQNIAPSTLVSVVAFGTWRADKFSGNGSTASFSLTDSPGNIANLDVSIGGVTQRAGIDFTWPGGAVINFTTPPPVGVDNILVRYGQALAQGASDSAASTFIQDGAGAVTRSMQDKGREIPSVLDWGAIGDGVADDLADFNAASAAVVGPVFVPPNKRYKLGAGIAFENGWGLWDQPTVTDSPYDTFHINRQVSSVGTTSDQKGGVIVRNTVNAGVQHHEFGYFSVLDSYSTSTSVEHVGIYSQATSKGAGASALWASVFEVRNTEPGAGGGLSGGTSVDHVLNAIEVDVVNKFAFSDTNKKIGVQVIAFGGGECTEGFSVHAAADTYAVVGQYMTGAWRYGLRIYPNSINPTLGDGVLIASNHARGINITGVSSGAAISLAAGAATTFGITIGANYTVPISIEPNKKIRLNGPGNIEGIEYASALAAVVLTGAAIGVTGHTTYPSATAGASGAIPAQVSGYLGFYVNGTLRKVPFYNA